MSPFTPDDVTRQLVTAGRKVATADEFDDIATMARAALDDAEDPVDLVAGLAAFAGHAVNFGAYALATTRGAVVEDLDPIRDEITANVLAAVAVWRAGPQAP